MRFPAITGLGVKCFLSGAIVDSDVYLVHVPSRRLGREFACRAKGARSDFASHDVLGGNRRFVSVALLAKNIFLIWKP